MLCAKCLFGETAGPGRHWCLFREAHFHTESPIEECAQFRSRNEEKHVPLARVLEIVNERRIQIGQNARLPTANTIEGAKHWGVRDKEAEQIACLLREEFE